MGCRESLEALASGRWDAWRGVDPACTRADAEGALGDTGPEPDAVGSIAGSPTAFRVYPATPVAPYGVQVWFAIDRVLFVQINSPVATGDPMAMLGEPELTLASDLGPRHDQRVYLSRGLVLHAHRATGELRRLYGFEPMDEAAYRSSWLATVRVDRVPRSR